MKKIKAFAIVLSVLLCMSLVCAFAACGEDEVQPDPPGVKTYTYEAEDTDISNLSGPVFSGEASGYKMIMGQNTKHIKSNDKVLNSISNNYFVSYFNGIDSTMVFEFESDEASEDNTLILRLASEWGTLKINPNNIEIKVNDATLAYSEITVSGERLSADGSKSEYRTPFKDFNIATNMKIVEGTNKVTLTVKARNYGLEGIEKYGPGVDCLKIKTKSTTTLTWDKLFEENKDQIVDN